MFPEVTAVSMFILFFFFFSPTFNVHFSWIKGFDVNKMFKASMQIRVYNGDYQLEAVG